jgi:hypothetical protein
MKTLRRDPLFWAPRVLCALFAAFISLFALDVFEGHQGIWQTTVALLMHLIPTAVLLVLLAVAWRWEWVGAVAFPVVGALYITMAWGRFPWLTYVIIAGPLFLAGGLFLANWRRKVEPPRPA